MRKYGHIIILCSSRGRSKSLTIHQDNKKPWVQIKVRDIIVIPVTSNTTMCRNSQAHGWPWRYGGNDEAADGFLPWERGFSTTLMCCYFLCWYLSRLLYFFPYNRQHPGKIRDRIKEPSQSSRMLTTILNGRVDEFDIHLQASSWYHSRALNDSSVYAAGKKLNSGKGVKTQGIFWSRCRRCSGAVGDISQRTKDPIEHLMTNYTSSLDSEMKRISGQAARSRYNYNLTLVWRPIVNAPLGSDIRDRGAGARQCVRRNSIYHDAVQNWFDRERVETDRNEKFNSTFGNISSTSCIPQERRFDRTQIEAEISQEFLTL